MEKFTETKIVGIIDEMSAEPDRIIEITITNDGISLDEYDVEVSYFSPRECCGISKLFSAYPTDDCVAEMLIQSEKCDSVFILDDFSVGCLIEDIHTEQCGGDASVFIYNSRIIFMILNHLKEADYKRVLLGMGLSDNARREYEVWMGEFLATDWVEYYDLYHMDEN